VFNLMTRSRRITYDNLKLRDPALVAAVDAEVVTEERGAAGAEPAFLPFAVRGTTLANRIVVSPMCQYSAVDGVPDDWHLVHLGSRAVGGAGLVFTEMTNVSAEGRITPGCAGIWNDAQQEAWARVVRFVHTHSTNKIGLQLAHAGRKASCSRPWEGDAPLRDGGWQALGPSAVPFADGWPAPKEMTRADMDAVREQFVAGAKRAHAAGFDVLELHMAHGYLLSSFLSPLSNRRADDYGGSWQNRARYPLEVVAAVRAVWPRPLFVRISATDWLDEAGRGFTLDEAVQVCRLLKDAGVDVIDVSSAGNSPESKPVYGRMYQVPFAERIRFEVGIPVMSVGGIQGVDHANTIVAAGRADLCAIGRPHLEDPYLTLREANARGMASHAWPKQYLAARRGK
jgi:anthraniloyl-CoA monooxygenase